MRWVKCVVTPLAQAMRPSRGVLLTLIATDTLPSATDKWKPADEALLDTSRPPHGGWHYPWVSGRSIIPSDRSAHRCIPYAAAGSSELWVVHPGCDTGHLDRREYRNRFRSRDI